MTAAKKTTTARTRRTAKSPVTKDGVLSAVAKQRTAKKATAPKEDVLKKDQKFEDRDWSFLQDKETSELHHVFAKAIEELSGVEITPKQVQAVLSMHPHFQRSETNKKRSSYVPLAAEIVSMRSKHMVLAHEEAKEILAKKQAEAPAKKAPAKKATTARKAPAKRTAKSA